MPTLEELHGALVTLGGFARGKGAQVASLTRLRVSFRE
jgi:hypothetical protein